ncbi:hypothetical protein JQ596_26010 [Bradyrhizobium manausense]|uniref:hypothetical protein n=1 Tax=Bradyrhizobium TaxID=374 RepID=UPI001BA6ED14|nr:MULTISPECIES: hypothetical protein [Bradyrhizobium]MBR0828995.1 hypothetical protein [Bradyrhizobium manausense]UVO28000.1 hypothetical protein KUF59_36930 [Bradyrhizobium arachidis]
MSEQRFALGDSTLKVLTFAGPLLASSLAITYDVGFFAGVGIGYFSFFSLSEHLVFALQSLPFAIPPVAVLLFWFTTGWYSYRLGFHDATISSGDTNPRVSKLGSLIRSCVEYVTPRPWLQRLYAATMILVIFVEAWVGQYAVGFLLVGLFVYMLNAPALHVAWKGRSPFLMVTCAFAALVLSFVIGAQRAHSIINSQSASETIGADDKLIPARLIRGGDKGILFFSMDTKRVRFLRWDAIKQIETL